jgi:hypothetical protein
MMGDSVSLVKEQRQYELKRRGHEYKNGLFFYRVAKIETACPAVDAPEKWLGR